MRSSWIGLIFLLLTATVLGEVRYDMPKEELIKELGKPTSTLKHPGSGREVLNYPKGVRIEIEKGVVVSIKGLDMAAVEAATKAAAEQKAEAEAAAKLEREAEEKIQAMQAAAAARAAQPAVAGEAKGGAVTMEQAVAALEKREAHLTSKHEKDYRRTAAVFSITMFFIKLLISWVVMVVALKLTTKYWEKDVDWPGILIAAAAESGTRAVIGLIGEYVFHTEDLYYIDQLAATIVLIFVLRKVSTNQSMNQAVGIALGVRLFSLLVNVLLFTLMLNLLH
jgi:hypothetical protein